MSQQLSKLAHYIYFPQSLFQTVSTILNSQVHLLPSLSTGLASLKQTLCYPCAYLSVFNYLQIGSAHRTYSCFTGSLNRLPFLYLLFKCRFPTLSFIHLFNKHLLKTLFGLEPILNVRDTDKRWPRYSRLQVDSCLPPAPPLSLLPWWRTWGLLPSKANLSSSSQWKRLRSHDN